MPELLQMDPAAPLSTITHASSGGTMAVRDGLSVGTPVGARTRFPGTTGTPDPPAQNRANFTAATRSIYNWDSGSGAGNDFWLPASWLTSAVLIAEGA
jgi:hypothetical protein